MFRTLLAIAALAAVPATAAAQAASETSTGPAGVTVHAPPQNPYVIRLDVTGKTRSEMNRLIWRAANQACDQAAQAEPEYRAHVAVCVDEANVDGLKQAAALLARRHQGLPTQVAIAPNIVTH